MRKVEREMRGLKKCWMVLSSVALMLVGSGLYSCSSINCPVQNLVYTVYKVYGYSGQTFAADTLKDTLFVLTRVESGDTVLLNSGVGLTSFSLPISQQRAADTLVFAVVDTLRQLTLDTLWIEKEDHPHFESVDCAPAFFHTVTDVRFTHSRIDTVIINHRQVDYDPSTEHFRIVFKSRP